MHKIRGRAGFIVLFVKTIGMDNIIEQLKISLEDDFLSKPERKSLRTLIEQQSLTEEQLGFLRNKIFELANQKATPQNYAFVLGWIKDATQALMSPTKTEATSGVFFSPGETCRDVIINQIKEAVNHLQICVFTISDDMISNAILLAHKRGLPIRIITDNDKSLDEGSDIDMLASAGIAIKMDRTTNHMHHKFMVADNKSLITGSYNWTRSAARFNHENILLTREDGVVHSFAREFEQLWSNLAHYE